MFLASDPINRRQDKEETFCVPRLKFGPRTCIGPGRAGRRSSFPAFRRAAGSDKVKEDKIPNALELADKKNGRLHLLGALQCNRPLPTLEPSLKPFYKPRYGE
jgi:hypothetical protein